MIAALEGIDRETLLKRLDEVPDHAIAKLLKKKFEEQRIHSLSQFKDYLNKRIYRIMKPPSDG